MGFFDAIYSIVTNKHVRHVTFYSVLIIMAVLTIHDIFNLGDQYVNDNKKAEMEIVFNDSMTFPNMTFCMTKKQAWSHFKLDPNSSTADWDAAIQEGLNNYTEKESFLKRHWDFRMVMEAYQVIATLNSMERETTGQGAARSITGFRLSPRLGQSRLLIKTWLKVIEDRNVTFAEFQQKVGFEALKRSLQRFQRLSFNEDDIFRTRIKITWLSLMELCFQPEFQEDSWKPIEEQGEYFTMSVSHNADTLEGYTDCMTFDVHGRPTQYARHMEGKARGKDGVNEELCLGMRHEVEVEITGRYVQLPSDEPPNACKEYEECDESEFDCKSRCRMEMIKDMCNCTAHTLAYLASDNDIEKYPLCDYTSCIVDYENKTFTDKLCQAKCLPDCTQIYYKLTQITKGRSQRPDLTVVTLFWSTFEYLQLEQQYEFTMASFFAALGGSLGLWLGLSILSFIQFIAFLIGQCNKKVRKSSTVHPNGIPMSENGVKNSRSSSPAGHDHPGQSHMKGASSGPAIESNANSSNGDSGIARRKTPHPAEPRGFNQMPVA